MNKVILILFIVLSACFASRAQGVRFETGSWEEILKKAKVENKTIFVDVYTQWCGPCKMVSTTVFPQPLMGSFYNERFINYKVDAESTEGKEFVKKYPVQGYPTFLYIDQSGIVVHELLGAKSVEEFIREAEALPMYARYGGVQNMKKMIEEGKADSELLYNNYMLASENEKPKALNLYLKSLPDEQFFSEDNELYQKVTLYDKELIDRLAEGLAQRSKEPDYVYSKKFNTDCVGFIFNSISRNIAQSIQDGDVKFLDELLQLKSKFASYKGGGLAGDLNVDEGRGLFFASPEYINLCFWSKNRAEEQKFQDLMVVYMDQLIKNNPPDSVWGQIITNSLKALKAYGPILPLRMHYLDVIQFKSYSAGNMLIWIDYFWRISPSNNATKKLCAAWINYIVRVNAYNPEAMMSSANLLYRIGDMKGALELMKKGIDKQKEIKNNDVKLMHKMDLMYRDIQNKKL